MKKQAQQKSIAPIWSAIRARLEYKRAWMLEEIRNYPPPIPACDAQFNHLCEERDRISQELGRLDAARDGNSPEDEHGRSADEFVGSSDCLSDGEKEELRGLMIKHHV
jgi:hypothetical protein